MPDAGGGPAHSRCDAATRVSRRLAAVACGFFVAAGLAFIPHLGIQNDEALFGHVIFEPKAGLPTAKLLGMKVPLMLMSYLGAFKGWIYRQIFRAVRPNLWSIRVPMLLVGAATLWLFYKLLRRIAGNRAAVFGCSLLAADAIFLLTICFDWGPVALQHLLLVAGMLLVLKFYQELSNRALGWAFFLFGLGMWDKALMVWMLSGMGLAALLVFPRQILRACTYRRAAIAVLAFALGALPLLVYNHYNHWETFRGNTTLDFTDIPNKAHLLAVTLKGDGLFGWMVAEDHETRSPHAPSNAFQAATVALSRATGQPRHGLMIAALVLAMLLAPFARGGELRAILFAAIAMTVAWFQMAVTRNAGGSVHHAVLLWPLPHLLVAVSFTAATRRLRRFARPALATLLVVLLVPSLLVMNQYYVQEIRNGGGLNWNDAIVPLAVSLRDVKATNVFCVDWGILDSVRLLNRGRTPVRVGSDPISKPSLSDEELETVRGWVRDPGHVFVAHTEGHEFFEGVNAKLVKVAAGIGFRQQMLAVIPDQFGRQVFEVYRFAPAAP